MARGILGMLLNKAMSQALNRQSGQDPSIARENRAALRKTAEGALEAGNTDLLNQLLPQMRSMGIDPNVYVSQAGMPSVEQQVQQILNEVLRTGQPPKQAPGEGTDAAVNMPEGGREARMIKRRMADIFTPEFAVRSALKQLSGIDISEDAFFKKQFYTEYKALRDAGVVHSDATKQLAAKFGAIPDDFSNLKEASDAERLVIHNRAFNKRMSNSAFDKQIKAKYPNADPAKAKAAVIFSEMAKGGMWIPKEAQDLVNRIQYHMEDRSIYMTDEEAAYYVRTTGRNPADVTPSELVMSRAGVRAEEKHRMIEDIKLQDKARWEVKLDLPIGVDLGERLGLTPNTMMREMLSMGEVPVGEEERAVLKAIGTAKKMRDQALRLFTEDGFNRFTQAGKLKLEKFMQTNPDLAGWDAQRLNFAVRQARANGQKGNLRWEELEPIVRAVPGPFHSRKFAKAYFDRVIKELEQMLTIERNRMQPAQEIMSESGHKIGEGALDSQGNKAIFRGKDQYGMDVWERE